MRLIAVALAALSIVLVPRSSVAEGICGDDRQILFSCETGKRERYITMCGREVVQDKEWTDTQYIFGTDALNELVYPENRADGKRRFFFSHQSRGNDYTVSIRFVSAGFTYRIYSISHHATSDMDPAGSGPAGVEVTDRTGHRVATIPCIERPYMFIEYLRLATSCDLQHPKGAAACRRNPVVIPP